MNVSATASSPIDTVARVGSVGAGGGSAITIGHALKAAVTPPPPTATPAERRQWMNEEAFILAWAGSGCALGALCSGRVGGLVGFALAGWYASIKVTRRR